MIDVTDLLSRLGIDYQKRGTKVMARCPNPEHHDRSASWMMRDEPGEKRHATHRCLACDFRGGPVQLVMTVLACERGEAIDFLSSSDNRQPLAFDVTVELRERKTKANVLTPEEIEFAPFHEWPDLYREYLLARDVDERQVERFGIGFCTTQTARNLRGRIWIPVRDLDGALAGWTARSISSRMPKYQSAHTRDGADPAVLFGEVFWPLERHEHDLHLVEGPFDALALDRLDLYVGALRGSELDPGQASKLMGWRRLVVATDPDTAGAKAALMLSGLKRWIEVVNVRLPPGVDVAKLAVDDPDELRARLEHAVSVPNQTRDPSDVR